MCIDLTVSCLTRTVTATEPVLCLCVNACWHNKDRQQVFWDAWWTDTAGAGSYWWYQRPQVLHLVSRYLESEAEAAVQPVHKTRWWSQHYGEVSGTVASFHDVPPSVGVVLSDGSWSNADSCCRLHVSWRLETLCQHSVSLGVISCQVLMFLTDDIITECVS